MRTLYVALGSNLGRRVEMLNAARRMLAEQAGPEIACSSYYETAPEGFASAHPFLNAAAAYRTALPPGQLLECTQRIERSLGRTKKARVWIMPTAPLTLICSCWTTYASPPPTAASSCPTRGCTAAAL